MKSDAGSATKRSRAGEPVAKLVAAASRVERRFGIDRGRFEVPEDFDAPLADEVQRDFEA